MAGAERNSIVVDLPHWLEPFLAGWTSPLDTTEARMALAVALSRQNLREGTGGPFGAVVVAERGNRLLGAGVNLVTSAGLSVAHAEIIAISSAQSRLSNWNLASAGSSVNTLSVAAIASQSNPLIWCVVACSG